MLEVHSHNEVLYEHGKTGEHDCTKEKCKPHECKPMAASTVRQVHSIISGALSAAQRWGWINSNPARIARRPKQKPPEPDPPTSTEAARLVEEAFEMDEDWGVLVWLAMTTGARRGELCALRVRHMDLDLGVIDRLPRIVVAQAERALRQAPQPRSG